MNNPKYEVGDKVIYHGHRTEIESVAMLHVIKGWLYSLVDFNHLVVVESALDLDDDKEVDE